MLLSLVSSLGSSLSSVSSVGGLGCELIDRSGLLNGSIVVVCRCSLVVDSSSRRGETRSLILSVEFLMELITV